MINQSIKYFLGSEIQPLQGPAGVLMIEGYVWDPMVRIEVEYKY